MNGQFVISLDFEKFWGVFDSIGNENYHKNLYNVDEVIDKLLDLCNTYNIKLTFATVGFLFNKNKNEFIKNIPDLKPTYANKKHNPYPFIDGIGKDQNSDPIHFGYGTLLKIINSNKHEIATHTYCHFYCMEDGQTLDQFEADLKMAIKVASESNITLKSIVFPRNQVNDEYLEVCKNNGILTYRGCEDHFIYSPSSKQESKKLWYRVLRLADSYFNLTGKHIYEREELDQNGMINIPASYFLRPYNKKLKVIEPFKFRRITKGMKEAAKKGKLFHLWFHPHNFGSNMEQNFCTLEAIFKTYHKLSEQYGFQSLTMKELAS